MEHPPRYNHITREDLQCNTRLCELLQQIVSKGLWLVKRDQDILDFFSLAEKALQDDRTGNPGALFRYLVEARKTDTISNHIEARAQKRIDSAAIYEIRLKIASPRYPSLERMNFESREREISGNLGYQPNGFAPSPFPQKQLPQSQQYWRLQSASNKTVIIQPGRCKLTGYPPMKIPYGFAPRLIFAYVVGEAVRGKQSVNLGRTKHRFLKALGVSTNSRNYHRVCEQIMYLATCQIEVTQFNHTKKSAQFEIDRYNVAKNIKYQRPLFVFEENQRVAHLVFDPNLDIQKPNPLDWNTTFTLSDDFYKLVRDKPMPVNLDHLKSLARSPRRMDIYTWLSHRVYRIKNKPVNVPLTSVHRQFAPDIDFLHHRRFRQKLKWDLDAIGKVYDKFNLELTDSELIVYASAPPIPHINGDQPR